jgi:hypothetical protein
MRLMQCGAFVVFLAASGGLAHAQWTATMLHPAGAQSSGINDIRPGQQVGYVAGGFQPQAAVWSGTAASVVVLEPTNPLSYVSATGSTRVFGARLDNSGNAQPGSWTGGAGSWVALNKAGFDGGSVRAALGQVAAGSVGDSNGNRAALWPTPASAPVLLQPSQLNVNSSTIAAISADQQVGTVSGEVSPFFFVTRAALWSSSAASFVELGSNPFTDSYATSVDAGMQVGYTSALWVDPVTGQGQMVPRAVRWTGTAQSQVIFGGPRSRANDIHGGVIAGQSNSHAGLWTGPDFSRWTDLHLLLPPGQGATSSANTIWVENGTVYVGGTYGDRAVMWTGPLAEIVGTTCDSIDFNNNGVFPEDQDVVDFFAVLAGSACSACNDIDFNNNSVFPEDRDVIDFFTVLAGGDCSS